MDSYLITENEYHEILLADFIIGARDFTTHRQTLVAETSITVHSSDVSRAQRRAKAVVKAMGADALAAVVGQSISPAAKILADSELVLFLDIPER